ncbi:hypothetical protein EDD27_4575 [Nonomuraea polychroma]|uniref:Uncharacterized protein n=1 Tax=Nonomuraea polychroma TaxID=46176 RepID=A0A438M8C3_9ACTN|nr:hypothetical protein [Nonomuraea polychroma]RVX41962.1 hypothetical protein EDD27_4575 [Nonomuraea polychroma]
MMFERFEKALLVAYFEAAQAEPSAALLGHSGAYSHVVIRPAESPFARWLVEQQIAVVTEAGEVALPYAGSYTQTLALAHSLIVRVRDVTTTITTGEKPPMAHWEALENLRERYALPEIINIADALCPISS